MFHVKHFGTIAVCANGLPQGDGEVWQQDLGQARSRDRFQFWPCDFCNISVWLDRNPNPYPLGLISTGGSWFNFADRGGRRRFHVAFSSSPSAAKGPLVAEVLERF
jgi:hypothetical protein